MPRSGGGASCQRRGPLSCSCWFSRCGASEASRFEALLPGLPGPDPGNFLYAQKVTKKAPGRPRTLLFAQSVSIGGETQLPLNFPWASGSFVIGAVGHALCLTALESMVVSFFLWKPGWFQQMQAAHYRKTDSPIPLTGRQPKPDEQPAADQMPKGRGSVAAHWQSLKASDWANKGGLGSPQRFFRPLLGVQKWSRRRQPRGAGARSPR